MAAKSWYNFRTVAQGDGASLVDIYIFDEISAFGVSAKSFLQELQQVPRDARISLSINSPGGDVFDGLAIYNLLAQRRDNITVRVEGIAASIASVIAMAGSRIVMPENSLMMIHNPFGFVMGESEDMRKTAEALDKIAGLIANAYARKTGKDVADIRAKMDEETWFTGAEAVDYGLADEVDEPMVMAASFDLSKYRHAPELVDLRAEQMNALQSLLHAAKNIFGMKNDKQEPDKGAEDQVLAACEAAVKACQAAVQDMGQTISALRADVDAVKAEVATALASLDKRIEEQAAAKARAELAAQGVRPVKAQGSPAELGDLWAQYYALGGGAERAAFYRQHRAAMAPRR